MKSIKCFYYLSYVMNIFIYFIEYLCDYILNFCVLTNQKYRWLFTRLIRSSFLPSSRRLRYIATRYTLWMQFWFTTIYFWTQKNNHQRYNKLSCFWLQGQRYSIQFAQNFQFPINNRAIVLHADENLKLREYAKNALKYLDLLFASSISFLRAGIPGDKFFHILSFRRQVYVYSNTE